jgi:GTPase SAR1 family protein
MGLCASAPSGNPEERKTSGEVEKNLTKDHQNDKAINKLLLLGAGESGKTTLFKQMISIYGKGLSPEEKASYIPVIHSNIINSMKTLIKYAPTYGPVSSDLSKSVARLEELKGDEPLTDEIAGHVAALWADSGIKTTYEKRASFQLTDTCNYFFDKVKEVASKNFAPSDADILRSRVRTTGIVENEFVIQNNKFKLFDVGGQRNERKKWIHCFEGVTAVLFVAAVSEYDQVLYEDETMNRMLEALTLFEEICNSRWFQETAMILFLNKRDLFEEKIKKVSLKTCFENYEGDNSFNDAIGFIAKQFEVRNHNDDKKLYIHPTCAPDRNQTKIVFDSVTDIIINQSLKEAGLN